MKQYKLHIVPVDGPTLLARTTQEYNLGYRFKVVGSDLLSMARGSYVTIDDIAAATEHYGLHFDVTFSTLTVAQHLSQQADTCYATEMASKEWG